jgi:hypothetical protein
MLMQPGAQLSERQLKAIDLIRGASPVAQEAEVAQLFGTPEMQNPLSATGKMIADLDRLPLDHPQRPMLEKAIQAQFATDENGIPADVQTAQWFMNASPEARDAFLLTKRSFDPQGAYARGEYDPSGYTNAQATGKETGKLTTQSYSALNDAIVPMRNTLSSLYRIRSIVETGPATGPAAEYTAMISPEVQKLRTLLKDQLLTKIGSARQNGVTFGAMSEGEWRVLDQTVANLGNYRDANLAIIDAEIAKAESQLHESSGMLERSKPGQFTAPPSGPVQAYPNVPQEPQADSPQQSGNIINFEDMP